MSGLLPRAVLTLVFSLQSALVAAQTGDWRPLLDTTNFSQWQAAGESPADFRLEGDEVIGQPIGNNPKNAFFCSPDDYHDFELRFDFRIRPGSLNSGVQFRSEVQPGGIVAGPQLEMDVQHPADMSFFMRYLAPWLVRLTDNPWRLQLWPAGGVYGESLPTGWIYPGVAGGDSATFAAAGERLTRPEGWNSLRLLAAGEHVRTWLNGELRADYRHAPTDRPGKICLQVHGGEYDNPLDYAVRWRGLQIREPRSE